MTEPATITGQKYDDLNGNGQKDPGEPGIDGWTIELVDPTDGVVVGTAVTASIDLNDDSVIDPETEQGVYQFVRVPGDYEVREVPEEGWVQTGPAAGIYAVTVTSGQTLGDLDFGNFAYATLQGQKSEDSNNNGTWDTGEAMLDGWMIELVDVSTQTVVDQMVTTGVDLDGDGSIDPGTEQGAWQFVVGPGTWEIREVVQDGWSQTAPALGSYTLDSVSGTTVGELDFGNYPLPTEIHGQKWEDLNGDGVHDPDEPGLDGWTIELVDPDTGAVVDTVVTQSIDLDQSGSIDPVTESGLYSFTGLVYGAYTVREVMQDGWAPSVTYATYSQEQTQLDNLFYPNEITFDFDADIASIGEGLITVTALGDLSLSREYIRVYGEGVYLGNVFQSGGRDNEEVTAELAVTEQRIAAMAADGVISLTFIPTSYVEDLGWDEVLTVELAYAVNGTDLSVSPVPGEVVAGVDFGNYQVITLSGSKFEDLDGSGQADPGEPRLAGWTIELYSVDLGVVTAVTVTDGTGSYSFENVSPGSYEVREVLQEGWVQTAPEDLIHEITVVSADVVGGLDFGNAHLTTLTGTVFNDLDGDGARSGSEPGMADVLIELVDPSTQEVVATAVSFSLDMNGDGLINPLTESGFYEITGIFPGTYDIRQVGRGGWRQTFPASDEHTMLFVSGVPVTGVDFGSIGLAGDIVGSKWHDLDADGVRDPGEPGLDGWTIELVDSQTGQVVATAVTQSVDLDGDGVIDPDTEQGLYWFDDVPMGNHIVREVIEDGWTQSGPIPAVMLNGVLLELGNDAGRAITFADFDGDGDTDIALRTDNGEKLTVLLNDGLGSYASASYDKDFTADPIEAADIDGDGDLDIVARRDADNLELMLNDGSGGFDDSVLVVMDCGYGYNYGEGLAAIDLDADGDLDLVSGVRRSGYAFRLAVSLNDGAGGFGDVQIFSFDYGAVSMTTVDADDDGDMDIVLALDGEVHVVCNLGDGTLVETDQFAVSANVCEIVAADVDVDGLADLVMRCGDGMQVMKADGYGGFAAPEVWSTDSYDNVAVGDFNSDGLPDVVAIDGDMLTFFANAGGADFSNSYQRYHNVSNSLLGVVDFNLDGRDDLLVQVGSNVQVLQNLTAEGTTADGEYSFFVLPGEVAHEAHFGNFQYGGVSGVVWHDLNGDGVRDADEPGLDGWTLQLCDEHTYEVLHTLVTTSVDLDEDGQIDPFTESGLYSFEGVLPGRYRIYQTLKDGWDRTFTGYYWVTVTSGQVVSDADFGAQGLPGEIHGTIWDDQDGDRNRDEGEPGLDGWVVELIDTDSGEVVDTTITQSIDLNDDGQIDPETETGLYVFTGVVPGEWTVQQVLVPGWQRTYPRYDPFYTFVLNNGETVGDINFGNRWRPGFIDGTVWHDLNGNGERDAGEAGLDGWTVELVDNATGSVVASTVTYSLDENDDGQIDPDTETGLYVLADVVPGTYIVREVVPTGWVQDYPAGLTYTVEISNGTYRHDKDFANYQPVSVSGRVWNDMNPNGAVDPGEEGLDDVVVNLVSDDDGTIVATISTYSEDVNQDGQIDPASEQGFYSFEGLVPGEYAVDVVRALGWDQTHPDPEVYHLVLDSAEVAPGMDFGLVGLPGEIRGSVWYDADRDGVRDAGEVGVPGVTIELLDAETGTVLETTTTYSEDVNQDGQIDPVSEQGLYLFSSVLPGEYIVRDVAGNTWHPTLVGGLTFDQPVTLVDENLSDGGRLGDMDSDGDLDIVFFENYTNDVMIYLNDGDGNFSEASSYSLGDDATNAVLHDLDGDGNLDVLLADRTSASIWILYGDGAGGISQGGQVSVATDDSVITVADFNGDGAPDIACFSIVSSRGYIVVLMNNGDGTFLTRTDYHVGNYDSGIFTGDVDRDGDLDFVVQHNLGFTVLASDGTGDFSEELTGYSDSMYSRGTVIADMDLDGAPDVVRTDRSRIRVAFNVGNGFYESGHTELDPAIDNFGLDVGDVDGDGYPDVLFQRADDYAVVIALSDGEGSYLPPVVVIEATDDDHFYLMDVDDDGDLDVVSFGYYSEPLIWAINNTPNGSRADGTYRFVLNSSQSVTGVDFGGYFPGDANGDNRVDGLDLAAWQQGYDPEGWNSNSVENGDWNGDGLVDGADLALWQQNYNPVGLSDGTSLVGTAYVPGEPGVEEAKDAGLALQAIADEVPVTTAAAPVYDGDAAPLGPSPVIPVSIIGDDLAEVRQSGISVGRSRGRIRHASRQEYDLAGCLTFWQSSRQLNVK